MRSPKVGDIPRQVQNSPSPEQNPSTLSAEQEMKAFMGKD